MSTILDRIVTAKKREVATAQKRHPPAELKLAARHCPPTRDFFAAVTAANNQNIHLIAEIKKRSPSAGLLVENFDPVTLAETYHRHGASALSVLTDRRFFDGRLSFIRKIKSAVSLPVLRKDFIVDEYQVAESRLAGADAILLIAEVLGAERIKEYLELARTFQMASIVEVHSKENLMAVVEANGPPGSASYLLGINNRDLAVQRTDLDTTTQLAALLPAKSVFISESGIATAKDVDIVRRAGACAILVGESLLRAPDIGAAINELLGL